MIVKLPYFSGRILGFVPRRAAEWESNMQHNHFMRGVGLGMLAGAVVGMMVSPGKKELKRTANKAVQAVGNAADNISEAISH